MAKCLHRYGVEYFQDIYKVIDDERFEKEVLSIPGQGSGISLSYFLMLSGSDDIIKPDRWIINFISNALDMACSQSCPQRLLSGACDILKQKYPHLTPRLLDNTIWKRQRSGKVNKRIDSRHTVSKIPSIVMKAGNSKIGPFNRDEIVLCSADAGPGSQQQYMKRICEAEYLFPGAKWVRAIGNAANRLNCRFVILTTGHGMVNPRDLIKPFDVHISGNEEIVKEKWRETIPALLKGGVYRVLVFYSGGCPRESYIEIMKPILHDIGIELLSFGRPNMWDLNKVDVIIELIEQGTTFGELRSVLRLPERLVYYPISR